MRTLSIAVLFVFLLGLSSHVRANWVDDWMNSASYSGSGPSAYEFSSRRYFSGGYASLRWSNKMLTPFSITPPTLRFGCGGVDIFMGSMSLLGFDYLVDRLKTILNHAGAFAFEYALHEYCPICQQIIRGLDAASDFLNQLQLDECRAGKALAATIMRPFSEEAQKDYTTLITQGQLFKGVTDSWKEFVNKISSEAGGNESRRAETLEIHESIAECGSFLDDLDDPHRGNKSILNYIAWRKGGGNFKKQIDLVRGLVGDVFINPYSYDSFLYIGGCGEQDVSLEAFVSGKLKKETFSVSTNRIHTSCSDVTEGERIVAFCKNLLVTYHQNIENRTPPSSQFDQFVKIVGFDFYKDLRLAYEVGLADTSLTEENLIVRCASYTYAASLLRNILSEVRRLRYEAEEEYQASCKGNPNLSKCVLCQNTAIDSFFKNLDRLSKEILRYIGIVEREYERLVLSQNSPCQSWKHTQKVLLEYERLLRNPLSIQKKD